MRDWGLASLFLAVAWSTRRAESQDVAASLVTSLTQIPSQNVSEGIRNLGILVSDTSFSLAMQYAPAQLSDILPTIPSLSPDGTRYELKVCARVAIQECMPYGPPTSGVPENVQGIWWSDGLRDPSLATSCGVGPFNVKSRVLTVSTYANQQWGYEATSSTWQGGSWTTSGAAFVNGLLVIHLEYHMYFNEDYTHAQIIPVIQILGNSIFIPTYIYDFTTDWIGQDMWRRSSTVFQTWRPPTGHYLWKRIINADGSKGPWYDKGWLTYKDGVPVAVPIAMVPPL